MDEFSVFLIASNVVLLALIISLILWIYIGTKTNGHARTAAVFFGMCFALYVVGQALVILNVTNLFKTASDISSYLYALAAILFAVGSLFQYRSVGRK